MEIKKNHISIIWNNEHALFLCSQWYRLEILDSCPMDCGVCSHDHVWKGKIISTMFLWSRCTMKYLVICDDPLRSTARRVCQSHTELCRWGVGTHCRVIDDQQKMGTLQRQLAGSCWFCPGKCSHRRALSEFQGMVQPMKSSNWSNRTVNWLHTL